MKKPTLLSTKSAKSFCISDLGSKACVQITDAINPLIADVFTLYLKTKNYHWHVYGSHYRDYHLLFDEQSEQILEMVDILAERVRKLGGVTIHSVQQILTLKTIKEDDSSNITANQMIKRLLSDNQLLLSHLRKVHKVCDRFEDVATASLLENFIDETERRIWFLYETHQS